MKTSALLIIFILMISCNSSSKQNIAPQLKETIGIDSVAITPPITNNNTETEVLIDSVNTTSLETAVKVKEEKIPVLDKVIPETKKKTYQEKSKTIDKKEVVLEKRVEKEVVEIEKKQVPTRPNHEIWDKLTKTYVSANGKVNYNGFKGALHSIDDYLLHLQNTPPTNQWSKNEKLAYWFNLYNAATVNLVAGNYPVKSIKDINGGKPWDKKFIKSGTNLYSLNDIENTVVRPHFNEPRLHVAFNCAAVSCPNLLNEAFTPTKLNAQLNSLSKKWINDTTKNNITPEEIQVSQIFNWYSVDFKEGVIPFINRYSLSAKANPDAKVTFLEYDWKLND